MAKRIVGRRRADARSFPASSERIRALEAQIEQNTHELELQFHRIAQIQAELDMLKKVWLKRKSKRL
jgi:hypothetical protein